MSVPELSLAGKVAVVTGGGTGIGRAIATLFAEAGADVVVGSRNLANLGRAAADIRGAGRRSLAVRTDTSQKADVDNLMQTTISEFGTIDILVNNSATVTTGELLNMPEDTEPMFHLFVIRNTQKILLIYPLCMPFILKNLKNKGFLSIWLFAWNPPIYSDRGT